MTVQKPASRWKCLFALLLGAATLTSSAAHAAGAPPKNLRVTGVTDWTVNLKWDAPNGRKPMKYVIQCSNGHSMTVPALQTSATFSNGFDYNRTYTFRAFAVDSNGSWSNASNSDQATLLRDTTPPTKPVVGTSETGPTHVDLQWSCADGDKNLRFEIYMNNGLLYNQVAGNARRIVFLQPQMPYTFTVRARDAGGNWSPMSDPFVVTTPPADPNDHLAPTTPPGLWGGIIDGATEAMVSWGDSTDNVTSQEHIGYFVYLNGVFEGATIDPYANQFTLYMTPGIINTIEVFAIDAASNRSAPATMLIDMR